MNKSRRTLTLQYLIWLMGALLAAQSVHADNKDENDIPWYQVEVIIFANENYMGLSSEIWPEPDALNGKNLFQLRHPKDAELLEQAGKTASTLPNFQADSQPGLPKPYELLESADLQLVPVAKKLQASGKYKPLLHIGWRQPTLSPDDSTPIYIYQGIDKPISSDDVVQAQQPQVVMRDGAGSKDKGNRFSSVPVGSFTYDSSQYGQTLPVTDADTRIGPALIPLYGTLRLSVSRYLHMEANLNYRLPILKEEVVPVNAADSGGALLQNTSLNQPGSEVPTMIQKHQAMQNFNLNETRRMRSKEIHYFDNPVIGIVVRVIPYEIPKIEPKFDPASQAFKTGQGTDSGTAPATPPQKTGK